MGVGAFLLRVQTGSCPDHWLSWRQIRTDEPISRKPGRHWYTTVSRYPKFSPITWPLTMPSGIPQWPAERHAHTDDGDNGVAALGWSTFIRNIPMLKARQMRHKQTNTVTISVRKTILFWVYECECEQKTWGDRRQIMYHPKPSWDLTGHCFSHLDAVLAMVNWLVYVILNILERKNVFSALK